MTTALGYEEFPPQKATKCNLLTAIDNFCSGLKGELLAQKLALQIDSNARHLDITTTDH
jgi:hypothetical protein